MIFDRFFKLQSVLNTDGYDRRTYIDLHNKSKKLQEIGDTGSETLPTFPHLMGDTWAGLFKNQPRVKPLEEIKKELLPNRTIMEKVFQHPEFTGLREQTKLDELASALGAVQMGTHLKKFIDDALGEETKNQLQKQQQQQQNAEDARSKADALTEALKMLQQKAGDSQGQNKEKLNQKMEQLKKQLGQAKKEAAKQEKQANKMAETLAAAVDQALQSQQAQKALGQALANVQQGIKDDTAALETMLGGLEYGTQPGQPLPINPAEAIKLAEFIRKNPKFRRIADLAGRMKKIAAKKQKSKTRDTIERTDISLGNDPNRLLPQEVAMMSRPETKLDFLKRFAEGKLMEYSPRAKDTLGRGPLVVCNDTSGSMGEHGKDDQAKAVMVALISVARKQNRAFAEINFASSSQVKTWEFPNSKKISPQEIIDMAEFFWNGGTDFMSPLNAAVKGARCSYTTLGSNA